jgi:hypothetical protein
VDRADAGPGWRLIAPSGFIDLGGAPRQPSWHDIEALARALGERATDWVPRLFTNGRLLGGDWRLADISGRPPRKIGSCVIRLAGVDAGCWFDFDTGRGGGPLDTYAHAAGLTGRALFAAAAAEVGAAPASRPTGHTRLTPCGSTRQTQTSEEIAREIAFTLSRCVPAGSTLVESYLASRRLPLPDTVDLLFHPDLTYYATRTAWPAMVAIVRDAAGAAIGLHRTYLARDGLGKAPVAKPKMMLGDVLGGAVRLSAPVRGTLGVAEGIETAIAASVLFRLPVWPMLSTSGMRSFVWPDAIAGLAIFADAGLAGETAALHLAERAAGAGLAIQIERPMHGDDFADDLCRALEAP